MLVAWRTYERSSNVKITNNNKFFSLKNLKKKNIKNDEILSKRKSRIYYSNKL